MAERIEGGIGPNGTGNALSKGGAPFGNRNRLSSGRFSFLTSGRIPDDAKWVKRVANAERRACEAAVLEAHGVVSLKHACLCQTVARHEMRCLLASRWLAELRKKGDVSAIELLPLLREIGNATDSRDKAIAGLELDRSARDAIEDMWASVLATPRPAVVDALPVAPSVAPTPTDDAGRVLGYQEPAMGGDA